MTDIKVAVPPALSVGVESDEIRVHLSKSAVTPIDVTPPSGIPGPIGPEGPQGVPGKDGVDGQTGSQGVQGQTGPAGPQGQTGAAGASSAAFPYDWRTSITAVNPTDGCIKGNNTNVVLITELYMSVHDKNGQGIVSLNELDTDDEIFVYEMGQISTWNSYRLTSPPLLQGTPALWARLPCVYTATGPQPFTPNNNASVLVTTPIRGEPGPAGPMGPEGPAGAPSTVPGPPGPPGVEARGAWSPVTTYQPDDVVTRDGSAWIATVPSVGVDPAADPSNTSVASFVSPGAFALGSPTALATGFTVDRVTTVYAMNVSSAFGAVPAGMTVGVASAIGVPGVGVQWMGKGTPNAQGLVTLDTTATLSTGVRYFYVLLGATGVMADQGGDMVATHMTWTGEFWYGGAAPDNNFGTYAIAVVLYGSTGDDAWQLFVEQGEPGPPGTDIVPIPYANWPPASPQPNTLYLRLAP